MNKPVVLETVAPPLRNDSKADVAKGDKPPGAGRAAIDGGYLPSPKGGEPRTSGVFYAKNGFAWLPNPQGGAPVKLGLLNSANVVRYVREHGLKAEIYLPGHEMPIAPRPLPARALQAADHVKHPELSPHNIDVDLRRYEQDVSQFRQETRTFLEDPLRRIRDVLADDPPKLEELDLARRLIRDGRKALEAGDVVGARRLADAADKAYHGARLLFAQFRDGHYDRMEATKHGLEVVRDGSKYVLAGLAAVGSAAAAASAVAAAELGTAAAAEASSLAGVSLSPTVAGVPLSASTAGMLGKIAIDITDPVARAAAGEKVDWGPVAAQTVATIVSNRFRSHSGKMMGRLLNSLIKNQATQNIARDRLEKVAGSVVIYLLTGEGARVLKSSIYAMQKRLAGKPVTVDEFCDRLVAELTDRQSLATDIACGILFGSTQLAVGSKAAAAAERANQKAD